MEKAQLPHVCPNDIQQRSGDPLQTAGFLHIQRTEVGGQIFSVMIVVVDDAGAGEYPLSAIGYDIPLGNAAFLLRTGELAVEIGFARHRPFFTEPVRRPFDPFRMLTHQNQPEVPRSQA